MEYLLALLMLGAVILVHELGHFGMARALGIQVTSFNVGFGPVLCAYQGPKVQYALRLFPLGGFVRFLDPHPHKLPVQEPDLLLNRGLWDRALVMVAGVVANAVSAYLILLGLYTVAGVPQMQPLAGVLVQELLPKVSASAQRAGVRAGDVILAVAGQRVEQVTQVTAVAQGSPGRPVVMSIHRLATPPLELTLTPDEGGRLGMRLAPNGKLFYRPATQPAQVWTEANRTYGQLVNLTVRSVTALVTGQLSLDQVSGPIGVVAGTAGVARTDTWNVALIAALVSLNLALINLLPLPGLDGGHLLWVAVEAVTGKRLAKERQEQIAVVGLVVLLSLGAALSVKDIWNIVGGGG
ncbi:RIP metalloprotease [Candidatus Cyanaurora vandensis]|uniref:M50 family metallopeptidase n=1 Tax=Candidatus Cyanaurora vandensis TaxID=2714958 RepID=UPI00257B303C|nr:site-2 protease family protein [Candidatus Cyanaurora vandensis]